MPVLSALLTPLLPLTRQVIGFIDQGLLQAPDSLTKQPIQDARGALNRLTLLAQVEEEHQPESVYRLLKHALDHLQPLDSASFGRLFVSDEPILAVRTLYSSLRELTNQHAPAARQAIDGFMPTERVVEVDDRMLQAACDAYAQYNESVGEPGEYFPDAMKAALQAALKWEAHRRWVSRMAALEEEAGGETTAGAPYALSFRSHPQGDPQ